MNDMLEQMKAVKKMGGMKKRRHGNPFGGMPGGFGGMGGFRGGRGGFPFG